MPHASGRMMAYASTGYFQPDSVPQGIDARGGFILLKEEKTSPSAKDSRVYGPAYSRFSFDYSEIEGGGEFTAGYYYGVKNLREDA